MKQITKDGKQKKGQQKRCSPSSRQTRIKIYFCSVVWNRVREHVRMTGSNPYFLSFVSSFTGSKVETKLKIGEGLGAKNIGKKRWVFGAESID